MQWVDKLRIVTIDPSVQKQEKVEAHWSHRSIAILKSSQAHVASSSGLSPTAQDMVLGSAF